MMDKVRNPSISAPIFILSTDANKLSLSLFNPSLTFDTSNSHLLPEFLCIFSVTESVIYFTMLSVKVESKVTLSLCLIKHYDIK
jgi:hypothetical protein